MTRIAIVAATRTPIGSFAGSLKDIPAHQLGATVIKSALEKCGVKAEEVSEVVLGQVLTAKVGQNPARQAAIAAGLPHSVPAITINRVCGSGLQAVVDGARLIASGDAEVVVAGGQESMSLAPHAAHLRDGVKFGDMNFADTMIVDGLWDAFNNYHMGMTAENVAKDFGITREMQDQLAVASQTKADAAIKAGKFKDEITPVVMPQKKGDPIVFAQDEYPRLSPLEKVAALKPAFTKDGTVTAANASGLNDGAAVVVLMSEENAKKRGLKPLAFVKSYAVAGVDPRVMGTGPIPASQKALEKAGWKKEELDLIEANEAFAAQAACVNGQMGWDVNKVNVNGGAIALGHPIGASGCRVLVTLLHEMQKRDAKKGLATLCIGGGMGIALTVER